LKPFVGLAAVAAVLIVASGAHLTQKAEEVRAARVMLIDNDGNARALLDVTPDPGGGAVFQLSHKGASHPQMVLTVNKDNQVARSILDSDRRPRIFLGLEPDGSPRLRLQDKEGKTLFQAPVESKASLPTLLKPEPCHLNGSWPRRPSEGRCRGPGGVGSPCSRRPTPPAATDLAPVGSSREPSDRRGATVMRGGRAIPRRWPLTATAAGPGPC
jgi:hypothetical protein